MYTFRVCTFQHLRISCIGSRVSTSCEGQLPFGDGLGNHAYRQLHHKVKEIWGPFAGMKDIEIGQKPCVLRKACSL